MKYCLEFRIPLKDESFPLGPNRTFYLTTYSQTGSHHEVKFTLDGNDNYEISWQFNDWKYKIKGCVDSYQEGVQFKTVPYNREKMWRIQVFEKRILIHCNGKEALDYTHECLNSLTDSEESIMHAEIDNEDTATLQISNSLGKIPFMDFKNRP